MEKKSKMSIWRAKNPEKAKISKRMELDKRKEKRRINKIIRNELKNTIEYRIYKRARNNAKKEGHEFSITKNDIIVPKYCPYLNWELVDDQKNINAPNRISIDRIDSTKGYVKGNIQVISRLANTMKNCATEKELIIFAENTLKFYNII